MDKRQYRVNQTLMISIETDIFDSTIPNAKRVEEMVETSIIKL